MLSTFLKKEEQHGHNEHDRGTEVCQVCEFEAANQDQQEAIIWLKKFRNE